MWNLLLPIVGVAELFTAGTAIISWAADEVVVVVAVIVAREVTALVIAVLQLPGTVVWPCEGSGINEAVSSLHDLWAEAGREGEQERGLSFAEGKSLFFELVEGEGARLSFCGETKKSVDCYVVKRAGTRLVHIVDECVCRFDSLF